MGKFFQRVATVEGKSVHVYKTRKGVFVSPDGKDFKTVVGADNMASNGVAHIIDGVLLPPAGLADALPNIVELAQSVPDLSTLVAAVVAGDLVDTLTSPGGQECECVQDSQGCVREPRWQGLQDC